MTKQQADLLAFLFDGQPHLLSDELTRWLEASARFTLFVETYRDKIRKKIRLAREPETALDLRGELIVAYALLSDRRLDVAYEPYASTQGRGPDFAVTYRANLVFNIEVARMRMEASDLARKEERFLRILLYKLGQMQPGKPNLLVIHTRQELRRALDLDKFMQDLKIRVEKKDPAFYELSRYLNPAAFYKDFLHLSGILLWAASPEAQSWVNKQARPALEEKVLRLVAALVPGITLDT
ncbi:MAG: hypothetical protein EHM33_28875 [Chloroflexi bacterium]|nr:MAG: hypothetical protein EHM33_28875 [Chloroflexota bacterium]